jgi:hypothetical protein
MGLNFFPFHWHKWYFVEGSTTSKGNLVYTLKCFTCDKHKVVKEEYQCHATAAQVLKVIAEEYDYDKVTKIEKYDL